MTPHARFEERSMHKPKVSQDAPTTLDLPRVAPRSARLAPAAPPPEPEDEAASLSEEDVEATDYIDETSGEDAPHETTHELRPLGARVGAQAEGTVRVPLPDGRHSDTAQTVPALAPVRRAR
jgi:hypothetical protein